LNGAATGTERIVHADSIYAKMRPGGEELEQVETRAPGVLDLLPMAPGSSQPRRHLEATRMWLEYAPGNAMNTFRAIDARTRTERAAAGKPVAITSSKDLLARFDPKTGAMTTLEQTSDFRYEEGTQRATASHAVLDQATQQIVLTSAGTDKARAWDSSGQVLAKTITMDQATGRMVAEGEVVSTREPEPKAAADGAGPLMATGVPLHGKAARMTISDGNSVIIHEGAMLQDGKPQGKAVVWQGANRIEGTRVAINRTARTLNADGQVTSILADEADEANPKAVITTVRADKLDYSDKDRLAHYTGTVRLARPGLDVRAGELRAYLAEGSNLDHMIADGQVNIVQAAPGRTRKASSEHAEYFTVGEKMLLTGGSPVMTDSVKGTTRGTKLTYTGADDTLLVEGAPEKPASSRIRRQ
jgi:lipopolysaccharide export system protein LptA